jgi:hypothetical protein
MTREAGKGLLAGMGIAAVVGVLMLIPHQTQAQYASPVQIIKNADNPAKMPYNFSRTGTIAAGASGLGWSDVPVPAGERLVIDLVAVQALMFSGDIPYIATCGEGTLGAPQFLFPLLSQTTSGFAVYAGTMQGPIYIEAGNGLNITVARNGTASLSTDSVTVAVSGHYVTLP